MTTVRARRAGSTTGLLALGVASSVAASPALDFGFGSRSQALAGAGVAIADDSAAVFQNPAGLTRADHVSVSASYSSTSYGLESAGTDSGLPTVHTFEAGLVVPGAIAGVPVAFGFALALPDGRLSRLREPQPTEQYWALDDAGPRLVDVGSTFAVRLLPGLSFGGGIGFQASLRGTFTVKGAAVAADGNGSEYESNLRHAVDADLTASRFPLLGVSYQPIAPLTFGLSYRGASLVQHHIEGTLSGTLRVDQEVVPVRYAFATKANVAYTPAQVALGASLRPIRSLLVTAELDFQRYSAYRSPYPETGSQIELSPELGVVIPDTPPVPSPPARFSDRFVPRFGVEPSLGLTRSVTLILRAGYSFQASPAPSTQPSTRLLALDRHVLSFGAGARWETPHVPFEALRFDLSLADALGVPETLTTTAGPGADRLSGHVLVLGATLGLAFEGE